MLWQGFVAARAQSTLPEPEVSSSYRADLGYIAIQEMQSIVAVAVHKNGQVRDPGNRNEGHLHSLESSWLHCPESMIIFDYQTGGAIHVTTMIARSAIICPILHRQCIGSGWLLAPSGPVKMKGPESRAFWRACYVAWMKAKWFRMVQNGPEMSDYDSGCPYWWQSPFVHDPPRRKWIGCKEPDVFVLSLASRLSSEIMYDLASYLVANLGMS